MEKAETQLTDAVIRTIRDAARKLTGPKRRQFQAQVALDYFGGSARKAQTVFGWSGKTVALGLNELRTGITCVDSFAMRGRRKSEDAQPQLLEDIVALVEPQSQTDPKFQGRFQYTRMTAKAVRQALIDEKDWTDEQLPHENTIGVILNRLGYRLRRVQKRKPIKRVKETDAIFETVHEENKKWLSFVWCGQGVRPDWLPWDPGVGLPLRWKPGSMVTASGLRVDKAGMSRATVGASRGQLSSVSVC